MKILIDNDHGIQTKGKRSPDGKLLEYAYTRDLARQIVTTLLSKGHNAQLLVPETEDIPLKERVRRAIAICTPTVSPSSSKTSSWTTNRISPTSSHKKADENFSKPSSTASKGVCSPWYPASAG